MATVSKSVDSCSTTYYTLPSCSFKRTGYTFAGWSITSSHFSDEGIYSSGSRIELPEDGCWVELTATWRAAPLTLTFDKTGGSGGDAKVTVSYGAWPHSITPPSRTGYTFAGYWTSSSGGTQYYDADGYAQRSWSQTSGATLYAHWAARSSWITFGKNGGSGGYDSATATYGSWPGWVSPPSRANYAFDGYWTTLGADGVQYFDANGYATRAWDRASSSVQLWAKWRSTTCVLTFDKTGGFGGDAKVTVSDGSWPHDITSPRRAGYVFAGYWTSASGGTQYYGADGYATRAWYGTCGIMLYAHWTARSSWITFGKNGGSGGDAKVTVTYGATPHAISVPSRAGYVFGGYWTTTGAGGVMYYDASGRATRSWDKTSNMTLWAKWTGRSYSVTFGKNGGTGGTSSATVTCGVMPHAVSVPSRMGYVFGGYWTTLGAGGVMYYDASGRATRNWDRASNVSLWAKWTPRACVLTFGKNGGSGGDDRVTVSYGATPHDARVPSRPGYAFGGYWTTTGAGGVQYFGADGRATRAWTMPSDTTLWAKWTARSSRITLGKNGGAGGDAVVTATYGEKPHDVTPPSRAGYVFGGYWTTTGAGGVMYYTSQGWATRKWDKSGDVTLWAKWTRASAVVASAAPSPSAPSAAEGPACADLFAPGYHHGVFADGSGVFDLLLDEDGTAHLSAETESDGFWTATGEAEADGGTLVLTLEDAVVEIRRDEGALVVAEMIMKN